MQKFTITDKTTPRLDAFLLAQFPTLGIGRLHKFLRENKIKVNSKKIPLDTRLSYGDQVAVYLPEAAAVMPTKGAPLFMQARPNFAAVYEDDAVLIADKPAGLPVEDETGAVADTLINRALLYLNNKGEYKHNSAVKPALCHRLDTGTSGLVMIAKTQEALDILREAIKTRAVEKQYLCVTFGHPPAKTATIKAYLQKDAEQGFVRVFDRASASTKEILTQYEVLSTSGPLALLRVTLITGRTHQIRAHLAFIDCPILGDGKYGNNSANRAHKCKYQALCAHRLRFPDLSNTVCAALSNKIIEAPKPWYYEQILNGTLQ